MAFLGNKHLKHLAQEADCIQPFDEGRIKNGAYELSLGSEVYLTDSKTGRVELLNANNREIDINPGQFALLLTKEIVKIPKDKIAFISIKAGEKLKGLVNVSGFHVDPGFHDHLLFSVYNAGPSPIVLNYDQPYFLIWFSELNEELEDNEVYNKNNEHFNKLRHIPSKYIEFLKRGELASPNVLLDRIRSNEGSLRNFSWAAGVLISLGVALSLKSCWDSSKFNEGYYVGIKEKQAKEYIDTATKKFNLDSIISVKLDSILKTRGLVDTSKTHG
jgi:dCTP deaminase